MANSKTRRKAAQRKRKRERHLKAEMAQIKVPDHIKVTKFESPEWQALIESEPSYKKARGIVQSLLPMVDNDLSYPTFNGWSQNEIRDKVLSLCTDPEMRPIEERYATKFGRYFQRPFSGWYNKVFELYKHTTWDPDLNLIQEVKDELVSYFKSHGDIEPLSIEEAMLKVTKGKNSGFPYFTKKWSKDAEMTEHYFKQAEAMLQGVSCLKGQPYILFKRIQINGDTPKMRPIQGAPKSDAIASKTITDPLVDLMKRTDKFVGFNGGENVYAKVGYLFDYKYLISADFSAFDANAQEVIPHVFDVIRELVPKRYWLYLVHTMQYYQHANLITPVGILSSDKINGVTSGAGFTSILGTIANAICTSYAMKRLGINDYKNLAFGDDIVLATNSKIDLQKLEDVMSEVGMQCNPEKQEVSEDYFSFLGYYHFRSRKEQPAKFPIMRLAPGFKYFERPPLLSDIDGNDVNSEELTAMILISKLEVANAHENIGEVTRLVASESQGVLTMKNLTKLMKYKDELRSHRTSRSRSKFSVLDYIS
jgi:hypothetical protein